MKKKELVPVIVWYVPVPGGDGSVYLEWFMHEELAQEFENNMEECWGEPCRGHIWTYEGSDVWEKAARLVPAK